MASSTSTSSTSATESVQQGTSQDLQLLRRLLAEREEDLANLTERLKFSKQSQDHLAEELAGLQALKQEYEEFKERLQSQEMQLAKLREENETLTQRLDAAQQQLQQVDTERKDMEQHGTIEREGRERDLQGARDTVGRLKAELAARDKEEVDNRQFRERFTALVAQREQELAEVRAQLQAQPAAGGSRSGEVPTAGPVPVRTVSAPSAEASPEPTEAQASEAAPSPHEDEVRVFQVNEEFNFLVLSVEGIGWATDGTMMVLERRDGRPVATVQLEQVDSSGFAIAPIKERPDPATPIRKGDLLMAHPPPSPAPQ